MEFFIEHAPVFTLLRVKMKKGEQLRAEAGAMVAMSPGIELEAKTTGKGLFGTLKAAVGGESLFASLFTAKEDGHIELAPGSLGDIIKLELNNSTILAEGGAYLAGDANLTISTQGSLKGLISGEGLFLQKISGTGVLFLNSYGAIIEKNLASGETYIVDTGHLVAFESSVQYKLRKAARSFLSSIGTGEMLACEYTGPGKIWIQTRNLSAFAQLISKFIPTKSS